ncbi:hypothetical protein [Candidatus Tisiphia endosymbiont of Micropterix aruncella]|uniref:hypothetical protein n=1 Tax=Candidatus Tisiphia endosymbiont of Micropterix aruncella TaxID=3066271 RepID=UPI003AA8DBDA
MSKDKITGRNKELLQETALRLRISEDEVLSKVPSIILSMAEFNPKILGGHLKRMESDKTPEKVLHQQVADDKFGGVVFFNKTQKEATSSTLGWSNYNKYLLETIAILSKKSEDEVLNEIPQDILSEALSNPGYLKEYLKTLRESLKINDSCTNDNPDDVAAGSSQMSSAASCALTGENLPFNEELD